MKAAPHVSRRERMTLLGTVAGLVVAALVCWRVEAQGTLGMIAGLILGLIAKYVHDDTKRPSAKSTEDPPKGDL